MSNLGAYLKQATGERWLAGVHDCCTFPADWALSWGRGDPMAEWRGVYASEAEADALICDAGGLHKLWDRGLSRISVARVAQLQPGDIGVIIGLGEAHSLVDVGAIWTGRRWAFRAPAGVFFSSAQVVAQWGLRHG